MESGIRYIICNCIAVAFGSRRGFGKNGLVESSDKGDLFQIKC